MPAQNNIGKRVKKLIKSRNLKQKDFAESIDMPIGTLNNIIRSISDPSTNNLIKIAAGLGANIHWIITGEGDPFTGAGQSGAYVSGVRQKIDMSGQGESLKVVIGKDDSRDTFKSRTILLGDAAGGKQDLLEKIIKKLSRLSPQQLKTAIKLIEAIEEE